MSQLASVVFFGTGPVSLQTLEGIHGGLKIEAVITRPDRVIHGRPVAHPVKTWATKHRIKVFTADNKAELDEVVSTANFTSEIGLVVDFGIIILPETIARFKHGILNSHFSLLPQWRGPDPITPALLTGARETGVSVMVVTPGLDTGPVVAQRSYNLNGTETITLLTKRLTDLSNRLLIQVVPSFIDGQMIPKPQVGEPSQTRKLSKEDGRIDWTKPAEVLEREIRGFLGWPSSYGQVAGVDAIITAARVIEKSGQVGQAFQTADKQLAVYCGQDALVINSLKPVGKREMTGAQFLAGRPLT